MRSGKKITSPKDGMLGHGREGKKPIVELIKYIRRKMMKTIGEHKLKCWE